MLPLTQGVVLQGMLTNLSVYAALHTLEDGFDSDQPTKADVPNVAPDLEKSRNLSKQASEFREGETKSNRHRHLHKQEL